MALGPHDSWCYGTRTERPQVIVNSSATAMLGLAGMAVLAVSDSDGEVEYAIETTAADGLVPGVRGASAVAQQAAHLGAGSAGRGSGGDVGVGQAHLALHPPRV